MNWARTSVSCNNFEVALRRSRRRKTIGISVRDGIATIHVPNLTPYSVAEKLVVARQEWISSKIREQQRRLRAVRRKYIDGEQFTYLGRTYRLQIVNGRRKNDKISVRLLEGRLIATLGPDTRERQLAVHRALISWYREHADFYLISRTRHYAALLNVAPRMVKIRDYKSRWGSCSPQGVICYNWRIVMAKPQIIDYLVVHELSHLHFLDHSKQFWREVEKQLPDFQQRRKWLAEHGWELVV